MTAPLRQPQARVSLAALRHNLAVVRSHLSPGTGVMAAVKANAYGHGAVPIARELAAGGVRWFCVATPDEAQELRRAGIEGRILLLIPEFERSAELAAAGVDLTVTDPESLDAAPEDARLHLKVDTGMSRLGVGAEDAVALARRIADSGRKLSAVWTHFARADESDREPTLEQLRRFERVLAGLEREGLRPPLVHASNSAGALAYPEAHFDLVRPGLALYGYSPGPGAEPGEPALRPVLQLVAPVTQVKRVRAGQSVSYGGTWLAPRDTGVATVRLGYADGYRRSLGNRAHAWLGGQKVPVVGRVCMDQLLLDTGDLPVAIGDEVTLLGGPGPGADQLAALDDTIPYELLTALGNRIARVYEGAG